MLDKLQNIYTTIDTTCKTARLIVPQFYTLDVDESSDGTVFYAYLDFYNGERDIHHDHSIELYTELKAQTFEDALYEGLKWAKHEILEFKHLIDTIQKDINDKLKQLN